MPRPLNWVRGEGTVKNQRWGLGSFMDTPVIPGHGGMGDVQLGNGQINNPSGTYQADIDWEKLAQIGAGWDQWFATHTGLIDSTGNATDFGKSTVGSMLKENWPLLAVGGLALLLISRR